MISSLNISILSMNMNTSSHQMSEIETSFSSILEWILEKLNLQKGYAYLKIELVIFYKYNAYKLDILVFLQEDLYTTDAFQKYLL